MVAMEACAGAHYWGREIAALGHEVRLVPPIYVKPFVKRNKHDAADAEAITEAAERPTMHFVAVKTEAQQAQAMLFHTRDLLVRQRTQTINALRGHLAEYGVVAPKGRARIWQLAAVLEDGDCGLPEAVVELGRLLFGRIEELDEKIDELDRGLLARSREDEETARLMTIPGIGPVTAMAIQAFAPPMESFRRGRDFSAWLGLVPRQHTTGGKPRLGGISKMGQRDLRRLLVSGAMTVATHAIRRGEITDSGWPGCWHASRRSWWWSRSPTRPLGRSGRWPRRRRPTGFALPPDRAEKGEEAKSKDAVGEVWAAGRRNE